MFSAKNYGLPKDLIEAAKKVHEKQLEKDSHGEMPSKEHVMKMLKDGMSETEMMKMHSDVDKGKLKKLVKDCKEEMNEERSSDRKVYNIKGAGRFSQPLIDPEVPNILNDFKKREDENSAKQKAPPLPEKNPIRKSIRKPKNEEVQFTEEELAEAFAIFLEENFHVDMLTEEDLDYVFENEFPQWLEEQRPGEANRRADMEREKYIYSSKLPETREQHRAISRGAKADLTRIMRNEIRGAPAEMQRLSGTLPPKVSGNTGIRSKAHMGDTGKGGDISTGKYQAQSAVKKAIKSGTLATKGSGQTGIISKMKQDATADAVKSDTMGGETSAPKPVAPKPVVRKPASIARNQVRRPAPKIDYKTPVTRRGSDGTYQLTSKGRRYVARKEAQERKKPFSASKFFSQMQQDGN